QCKYRCWATHPSRDLQHGAEWFLRSYWKTVSQYRRLILRGRIRRAANRIEEFLRRSFSELPISRENRRRGWWNRRLQYGRQRQPGPGFRTSERSSRLRCYCEDKGQRDGWFRIPGIREWLSRPLCFTSLHPGPFLRAVWRHLDQFGRQPSDIELGVVSRTRLYDHSNQL